MLTIKSSDEFEVTAVYELSRDDYPNNTWGRKGDRSV